MICTPYNRAFLGDLTEVKSLSIPLNSEEKKYIENSNFRPLFWLRDFLMMKWCWFSDMSMTIVVIVSSNCFKYTGKHFFEMCDCCMPSCLVGQSGHLGGQPSLPMARSVLCCGQPAVGGTALPDTWEGSGTTACCCHRQLLRCYLNLSEPIV